MFSLTATDWTAIGVIVAFLVGLGSIWFQAIESRRTRKSRGLEIVATAFEKWNGEEMRAIRKNVATMLIETHGAQNATDDLFSLLNFFDSLGFMVKEKIVKPEYVWSYFGTWILPYSKASEKHIDNAQSDDPNVLSEVIFLFRAIKNIEIKRHPRHSVQHILSNDAIRHRLQIETELTVSNQPRSHCTDHLDEEEE